MKATLLEVVQNYLNRTDGFYVNSIFETDESQQVAEIAQEVFYNLYSYIRNAEFSTELRTLDAVSDVDRPNYLRIPDVVHRIQDSQVYYDVADTENNDVVNYVPLAYLPPEEFLEMTSRLVKDTNAEYTIVQDFNRTRFAVQNNQDPQYYTSFDGEYIVFDSFDSNKEATLQESKSRVFVSEEPVFLLQDDYVIDVPNNVIQLYKDMVLVECYESLRQEPAPSVVARRARRDLIKLQQETRTIGNAGRRPRYSRREYHGIRTRRDIRWESY